jgi:hypothetical protein
VINVQSIAWRKSSYSDHQGGNCVELRGLRFMIEVRDSKNPNGAKLALTTADWHAFTRRIKDSQHDLA